MSKELRQQVISQLEKSNLRRLGSLGQNFLVDEAIIGRICHAVAAGHPDQVLEIGPGLGAVTVPLAKAVKRVVGVELDRGLAKKLAEQAPANVRVVQGDITKQDLADAGLTEREYVVFGSLPFNMGTAIIRFLLENEQPPSVIYAILQQEVIDRILAKDKQESILSLSVKFYGQATYLFPIPRRAYQPQPRVDTGFLRIDSRSNPPFRSLEMPFFRLIKAGFSSKRKYLASNLTKKLLIPRAIAEKAMVERKLTRQVRAEALAFADWVYLARKLTPFLYVEKAVRHSCEMFLFTL